MKFINARPPRWVFLLPACKQSAKQSATINMD